MLSRFIIFFLIIIVSFSELNSKPFKIIRDAETENFLSELANILLDKSENSEKFEFYIDNQKYVNASVIPGPKFFFTTQLLLESKNVEQIAGVIAHELGHVIGGHFTKINQATRGSSFISIISSILAVGAIASGSPEAGNALLLGGQQLSRANILAFSRKQESIADQTSIRLMKKSGLSLKGLIEMFKLLERKEKFKSFNPYFLTHPLSKERKQDIEYHLSLQTEIRDYPEIKKKYKLIKAKLNGFFLEKDNLVDIYGERRDSIESIYAYSLNFYREGKIKEALELLNKCITYDPKNPYFRELKAQIYFENGKNKQAVEEFRKIIFLKPNEKSFKLFLAKALYHTSTTKGYSESIDLLQEYIKDEDYPVEAWHYLGLNYGKKRQLDYSSYAFAEKFFLVNEIKNAKVHIAKVKKISQDEFLLNKVKDLEYEIVKKERK